MKSSEVKASERRSLQDAVNRQQGLASALEALGKAEAEESKRLELSREAAARLEALALEEAGYVRERLALAEKAREAGERLAGLAAATAELTERIERYEAALRHAAKERDEQHWSLRLAEALRHGDPCPVCGSTEHPSPAASHIEAGGPDIGEQELEQAGLLAGQARDLRYTAARASDAVSSLFSSLELGLEGALSAETAQQEAASASASEALVFPAVSSTSAGSGSGGAGELEGGLPDGPQARAVLVQQYEDLRRKQADWRQVFDALEQEVKTINHQLGEIQNKQASATAEAASLASLAEQSRENSRACREVLARLQKEWDQEHPGLSPEEAVIRMEQIHERDLITEDIKQRLAISIPFIEEKTTHIAQLQKDIIELDRSLLQWELQEQGKQELLRDKKTRLTAWIGEESADVLLQNIRQRIEGLREQAEAGRRRQAEAEAERQRCSQADVLAQQAAAAAQEQEARLLKQWEAELAASPFESAAQAAEALLDEESMKSLEQQIQTHRDDERELIINLKELEAKLEGRNVTEEEWQACCEALRLAKEQDEAALQLKARSHRDLEDLEKRHVRWQELEKIRLQRERDAGLLAKLQSSLRGNAFVEYVAEEQLMNVSQAASQRLRFLTNQRYSLECDSGGGFVICDDANGGVKRPVATLSGGETFLTSLALALALSAQIQLRGQYPLQFFFLDEGFGTLDPELLDTVITSLEHLHHDHLSVGIISHVAELRARLARKLIVIPAESGGEGSRVTLESL
uniref:SbcC/MukB-like Walker B domain-containing protein n=1 Tax=Paenibacillus ihumii TaxID=687436 RepID=UPI0006D788EE|nr:SbcC/MukB-like Walker B domain-containing protein [Paenibacillus ihumii]